MGEAFFCARDRGFRQAFLSSSPCDSLESPAGGVHPPEHDLEATGLYLARVVSALRRDHLAARHAVVLHGWSTSACGFLFSSQSFSFLLLLSKSTKIHGGGAGQPPSVSHETRHGRVAWQRSLAPALGAHVSVWRTPARSSGGNTARAREGTDGMASRSRHQKVFESLAFS